MLKIILDTNVVIASLRSRNGASHRLVSMIGNGRFELIISVTLALEYETILRRQASEISMTPGDIDDFVGFICANAIQQGSMLQLGPSPMIPAMNSWLG